MKTILYITFSKRSNRDYYLDASVIYRCFQPCEFWRLSGCRSFVVHYLDAIPEKIPADIVVFHRPRWCPEFSQLFEMYNSETCVADFDDCLFDSSILETHPAYLSEATSLYSLKKQTQQYFQATELFEKFFVSSDGIKASIDKLWPNRTVFVVRNGISSYWRNLVGGSVSNPNKKIVSYFSGTANHSADLKTHFEALAEALGKWPEVDIHIYGQLKLGRPWPQSWSRREPVSFHQLPQLIHRSYICIAPIMDTPFNRCKSSIKFLESASFGKPLITQPLPEFTRLPNAGLLLVNEDWSDAISQLMDDEKYRLASAEARMISDKYLVPEQMKEISAWICD